MVGNQELIMETPLLTLDNEKTSTQMNGLLTNLNLHLGLNNFIVQFFFRLVYGELYYPLNSV